MTSLCSVWSSSVICCHRSVLRQRRHLLGSFAIGRLQSCDQNRIMASAAAVRSSMGLTLRLSRVLPDCSTCPLYRLKTCVNSVANLQRRGPSDSFRTINRHLQTTISEWCSLLTLLALRRSWVYSELFVYVKAKYTVTSYFYFIVWFRWLKNISKNIRVESLLN